MQSISAIEKVLIQGDLAALSEVDRVAYYSRVCESLGLNPLTQPFAYIKLNGKLTLYAKRECTEQLRKIHSVSITIVGRELVNDVYVVTARATLPEGRCDESVGAVFLGKLQGEQAANNIMKAETKAKRRVTLSICGLGMLDETETETIEQSEPIKKIQPTLPPKKVVEVATSEPQPKSQDFWETSPSAAVFKPKSAQQPSSVAVAAEPWKSWKKPEDAVNWAIDVLVEADIQELWTRFEKLEPGPGGKKAVTWYNTILLEAKQQGFGSHPGHRDDF